MQSPSRCDSAKPHLGCGPFVTVQVVFWFVPLVTRVRGNKGRAKIRTLPLLNNSPDVRPPQHRSDLCGNGSISGTGCFTQQGSSDTLRGSEESRVAFNAKRIGEESFFVCLHQLKR